MPETTQQPARDWQEDWKHVEIRRHGRTLCNWLPVHTMHGIIEDDTERLAYWMQEYRESMMAYATLTCEYQSLKSMFLRMREECGAEKKRASAAEERELKIKDVLEDIMYASTYSTDVTFEEIGKAKEIYKSIYGELSYEKGNG